MFDKETLERIIGLARASAAIEWDKVGVDATQAIALPDDLKIHDLERFFPERRRFRGKFQTTSIESFAKYLDNVEECPCFIDADKMAAMTVVDLGDPDNPGHCDHIATLSLRSTAVYQAVMEADGRMMDQRAMAEWLEDWRNFLSVEGGEIRNVVAAVRSIDVKAKADSSVTVGTMGETQSKFASVEATSKFTLPDSIAVTCTPCAELTERRIELSVSVVPADKPLLKLRIVGKGELLESVANEFAALLKTHLPNGHDPILGKFEVRQ